MAGRHNTPTSIGHTLESHIYLAGCVNGIFPDSLKVLGTSGVAEDARDEVHAEERFKDADDIYLVSVAGGDKSDGQMEEAESDNLDGDSNTVICSDRRSHSSFDRRSVHDLRQLSVNARRRVTGDVHFR